jgi:hypothetical protein
MSVKQVIPSFWVFYVVKKSDTLASISEKFGYSNPGPIVAFNCDRLPNAIQDMGGQQPINPDWTKAHSKKNMLYFALGDKRALNPHKVMMHKPLASNQINWRALQWNHAAWPGGEVVTVSDSYPISVEINQKDVPYLEVPWKQDSIEDFISMQQTMRVEIVSDTYKILNQGKKDLADLKRTLFWVDFAAAIFMNYKDLVKLGISSAKSATTTEALAKEAYKVLALKLARTGGIGKKALSLSEKALAETLTLPKKVQLKKGFGFWINNSIGWLSPSKWTACYAAVVEEDADIAWWGAEAVDAKMRNRVIDSAKKRIEWIDVQLQWASKAKSRSFYRHVVTDKV